MIDEATTADDLMNRLDGLAVQGFTMSLLGDSRGARASADAALQDSSELVDYSAGIAYTAIGVACLAGGDATAARQAYEAALERTGTDPQQAGTYAWSALAPLACGDLAAARRWADDVVSLAKGGYSSLALTTRARVAIAQGELKQAERDTRSALAHAVRSGTLLGLPDTLECIADLAADAGRHREAGQLFGAADAIRQRTGQVRFKIRQADHDASVAALRDAMGEQDFDDAWAEGTALSTEDVIAYVQRGRGERKRPHTGWASLTPTEHDVVQLVSEGLSNKDIATRLFVSPRTVQAHLTHVYAKLGLASRVQLVHEAARHA